jgi:hypothetical protein
MNLGIIMQMITKKLSGKKTTSYATVSKFFTKTIPNEYSNGITTLVLDCVVAWSARIEPPSEQELAVLSVFVKNNNGDEYLEKGQYGEVTDLQDLLSDDTETIIEAAKRIVDKNTVNIEALLEISIDKNNFNTWTRRMAIWCLGFMVESESDMKETIIAIYNDETDDAEVRDHALEAAIRLSENQDAFIEQLWNEDDKKRMKETYDTNVSSYGRTK